MAAASKRRRKTGGNGKKTQVAREGRLSPGTISAMREEFESDPAHRIVRNAVTQVSIAQISNRREVVTEADHSFSIMLDDWKATSQKRSGRCWLFAGLNLLRAGAMKKMKLKDFEFSQNFPMFWDKLEKANYLLEAIIETADRDVDDRTVAFLLRNIVSDGGQWNMFVNLVKKHGLVPKAAMPETESSSNTREMNRALVTKLRQGALRLRKLQATGAGVSELRVAKGEILKVAHRILSIHLGTPPTKFDWQWRDKDRKFHRDPEMTPQLFAAKYVTIPIDDYVCLVHDPRRSNPPGRTYTVEYLGNVVGGDIVTYLNVDIGLMKKAALKTLHDGEPVWFGCDCGKQMDRDLGLWDANLRDVESIYGTTFDMTKEERLLYGATQMNHAMLFTGVDMKSAKPRRWRVENSWGPDPGNKGFFLMNDSWFDEHMFEIAARKKYLPPKLREALRKKPTVLPAWDPMGSLARVS
jgi:bleomycin hydrolase